MKDEVLFTHELDSRNAFGVADCGTFSALPNGDDLEVGVMPRPDLPGAPVREYEEVWRELPFVRMEGHENVSFVLESATGGTQLKEGEEKEITRTFIGAIWGSFIALRQTQVLARPIGETRTVIKSGAEVSAKREDFVQGQGFVVRYSLGPEADELPTHSDIQLPASDGSLEKLVVCGQEYVVRSWEKS